jgi:hypothetical protein
MHSSCHVPIFSILHASLSKNEKGSVILKGRGSTMMEEIPLRPPLSKGEYDFVAMMGRRFASPAWAGLGTDPSP